MPSETVVLASEALAKSIGERRILSDVSFEVGQGATLGVLGPNGAGKSTLLKVIAGIWGRTSGSLWRFGAMAPAEGQPDPRVGFLGHRSFLYPGLSARENLLVQAKLWGIGGAGERVDRALAEVGLAFAADEAVRTFSRGMQQRAAMARAFFTDPQLLLLDEPYTGLDLMAQRLLDERLSQFRANGGTTLLITHHVDEALRVADAVAYMMRGRLVWWGESRDWTTDRLTAHYHEWITKGGRAHP